MRSVCAGAAAAAFAGLIGCASPGGRRGGRPPRAPVAVEVAPVRRATVRDVGRFTGSVEARSYFVVAPKVAGRLTKLHVDIGDTVRRGELVAELDDEEYAQGREQARAELTVARANVEQASSSLATARREFARVEELKEKKISSESELDAARGRYEAEQAAHKVADAQVDKREAALKAAEVRLSYTRIRVSWEDGADSRIIGERFIHEGAMLTPNAPIVSVIDISSVKAIIHVVERDYARIAPGQEAAVSTDAFPGRTFGGRIVRVAPLLKERSRQARVEIEIENPDLALKPGMFVGARIVFAVREGVVVVPVSALARREDRQGVFIVDEEAETVRFVPVRLGIVEGDLAEVEEPELSGIVVIVGQHLLEEGSGVILPGDARGREGSAPRRQPAGTGAAQ